MKSKKICRRSGCPISFTLDILGDKWTLLIIRDLMFKGKSNYGEFLESEEKIATNILADRLQRLEDEGIISKKGDPQNKKKNIYLLTDKGIDLMPMVLEMVAWGAKYDVKTEAPKEFIENLKKNKEGMTSEMMKGLRQKIKPK